MERLHADSIYYLGEQGVDVYIADEADNRIAQLKRRITELEQELTESRKALAKCTVNFRHASNDGYKAGMKQAAEIAMNRDPDSFSGYSLACSDIAKLIMKEAES